MLARSLQCPNCGGQAHIPSGQKTAVCQHCGKPVTLAQAALQSQSVGQTYPSESGLRLGLKGLLGGKEYEITGRQVMYQVEDGEFYRWEEWVLISADGDLRYLEHDEGKWKLSWAFTPDTNFVSEGLARMKAGDLLPLQGHAAIVTERATYEVARVEGEFPYRAVQGRRVDYLDATYQNQFYSAEWTPGAIEFYEGHYVDARQVYTIFGLHHLVRELDLRERVLSSRRLFAMVCLILALITFGGYVYSRNSGQLLARKGGIPLSGIGADGTRFGPISLTAQNRVHRLELQGHMQSESHWVQAIVEDEAENELFSAARDMWDESGYDDGYWHEWDLHAETNFVVRKPGNYYVRLYTEPDPSRAMLGTAASTSFLIKERVLHSPYLGWWALILIFVGVIAMMAGSPEGMRKIKERLQEACEED